MGLNAHTARALSGSCVLDKYQDCNAMAKKTSSLSSVVRLTSRPRFYFSGQKLSDVNPD